MSTRWITIVACTAVTAACAVGPNYRRPTVDVGRHYAEAQGWKPSTPGRIERAAWWRIYRDPVLDRLERQAGAANPTVESAEAAVAQARALVREARAGFWPTVTASFGRNRTTTIAGSHTVNSAGLAGTWDLDVWGRTRREVEGSAASAAAAAAALAATRLSVRAELATDYFALRAQDRLVALLADTVAADRQALAITESRYRYGVAAEADVVSARTQWLASESQQVNAGVQRALLVHAIAVLLGMPPSRFSVAPAPLAAVVPVVPAGVPSALLERRPDVAEAERRVAAANAQIGVARAAFFPALQLTGSDDYVSGVLATLIRASNQVWALGPQVAQTVFAGGLLRAQAAAARAAYDASVADYRQTVLSAVQQVEDDLATLRILQRQAAIARNTLAQAREAEALTLEQYKAGVVPYSSVITAQTTTLASRETVLNVHLNRLTASVSLIAALGGGWDEHAIAR
ncbi:MAG: efflux transporter outer membrane subunit [Gammaproteobacteria bacterium]|nr:efflux transporter outer membrane subunit [Gammaproteobacteria bacterium]